RSSSTSGKPPGSGPPTASRPSPPFGGVSCTPEVGTNGESGYRPFLPAGIVATQLCDGSPGTILRSPRGGRAWSSSPPPGAPRPGRPLLVQRGVELGSGAGPWEHLDGSGEGVASEQQVRYARHRLRLDDAPSIRPLDHRDLGAGGDIEAGLDH